MEGTFKSKETVDESKAAAYKWNNQIKQSVRLAIKYLQKAKRARGIERDIRKG